MLSYYADNRGASDRLTISTFKRNFRSAGLVAVQAELPRQQRLLEVHLCSVHLGSRRGRGENLKDAELEILPVAEVKAVQFVKLQVLCALKDRRTVDQADDGQHDHAEMSPPAVCASRSVIGTSATPASNPARG